MSFLFSCCCTQAAGRVCRAPDSRGGAPVVAPLLFLQAYPTPQAAQAASVEQIAQVLRSAGHTIARKVAPAIFEQLHQPTLQANAVTIQNKSRLVLALIAQLLPLLEQIAAYDKDRQNLSGTLKKVTALQAS